MFRSGIVRIEESDYKAVLRAAGAEPTRTVPPSPVPTSSPLPATTNPATPPATPPRSEPGGPGDLHGDRLFGAGERLRDYGAHPDAPAADGERQ